MRKILTRIVTMVMAVLMLVVTIIQPVKADVPYMTFSQNGYGEYIRCQTAYTPYNSIYKVTDKKTDEVYFLSNPSDMILGKDGNIYIADTGKDRIIVCDKDGYLVKVITDKQLYNPKGIYVTDEGYIYVAMPKLGSAGANAKTGCIMVFDSEGNVVKRYLKPEGALYGADQLFMPTKVIVDKGGIMYIVSTGNSNGIVQISPTDGGTFLGYFGTGDVVVGIMDVINHILLSDEQLARKIKRVPQTNKNLAIDDKGVIYTILDGISLTVQPLKKLNKAGASMMILEVMPWNGEAVATGKYNNIFVATHTGYIYEYTENGKLLFRFGGKDSSIEYRSGLFQKAAVVDIDVDKNDLIYVLDTKLGAINVFQPTEFTNYVHQSLGSYQEGDYNATKMYLEKVIDMNSMFDYANQAMGLALYREENYKESMKYYRLAKDKLGYSDAYWEIRNDWLTKNVVWLVLGIVLFVLIIGIVKRFDRKNGILNPIRKFTLPMRKTLVYRRLVFGKRFMRHPIDGAYEIKHYGMASVWFSFVIIFIYCIIYIINKYFGAFLVKMVRDGRYNIGGDFIIWFVGILAASAITYLICTINDGEGRFKEIMSGYVYSFTPYLFLQPILYVAGMFITNNEMFLITFTNLIMLCYIAILMFLSIMEINNYTVRETIKIIFLTAFAALVTALILFVIYILAQQLVSFARTVYGEVVYRIEN